jgi:hypothetical protein
MARHRLHVQGRSLRAGEHPAHHARSSIAAMTRSACTVAAIEERA